jgi:S1-C subfamily serine protease
VALLAAIVGGLATGAVLLLFGFGEDDAPQAASDQATPATQQVTVEQTSAVTEAAARGRASVVRIESVRRVGGAAERDVGSGVVIDEQGYLVTNAHVVLGTESLKAVLPDGTERPAILVGHDYPFTDLAVLQVGPGNLTAAEVGDSGALRLGEAVVAIGNPLAEFEGTVTVGVVSGLNRTQVFDAVAQRDLIQTDAAINNGNSGGALLNLQGQFVGMPTSVIRGSGNGAAVEGIAFALPSNRVLEVARAIIANQGSLARPTLGVEHIDLTPEGAAQLGRFASNEGALVTDVQVGGPADVAGIREGDIITRVGATDVNATEPLLNALMAAEPGQRVRVVLNRDGRIIETEVQLGTRS